MAKVTLNKTIAARKLSKTGVPTSDPEQTIPFGAIIERVERDSRGMVSFRYLTESYQCTYDMLASAVDGGAMDDGDAPSARSEKSPTSPPSQSKPRLDFETIKTNVGSASRAKVPGGWLVRMDNTLVFYPDPDHRWV